jgi:hypothetical protein
MAGWQELKPFPDAVPGLQRLRTKFKLVVLSNGEREFLAHLVKNRIRYDFDAVISGARLRVSRRLRQTGTTFPTTKRRIASTSRLATFWRWPRSSDASRRHWPCVRT